MRKHIIWLVAAACIMAAPSCKKTETTTTTPSLTGLTLSEAVPYVRAGEVVSVTADVSDIYASDHTDPGELGIIWQLNEEKKDTLDLKKTDKKVKVEYSVTETGKYTINCYVYAKGGNYYNATASREFKCIDPDTALTGVNPSETVTIGGLVWQTRNLSGTESGVSYKDASCVDGLFGKYYTWEEALTACPDGWHLPSAAEWDSLGQSAGDLMAKALFMDEEMWEAALGQSITDLKGFSAIPTGYQDKTGSMYSFRCYGKYALFWTSTISAEDDELAELRYIIYDQDTVIEGTGDKKTLALSVRCVED